MKVLWLCNVMLPFIAKSRGQNATVKEGWLSGLADRLLEDEKQNNIELGICFPTTDLSVTVMEKGRAEGVTYYLFYEDTVHPECYDENLEFSLKAIVDDFKPDLVHIFGTEFPHTLAMAKAFNRPDRILVGIQGVCSEIAKEYMADLPENIQKSKTFRDILKKDSLIRQQEKFVKRGEHEIEALSMIGHITGRTPLDKKLQEKHAKKATYHFMNETLRGSFYQASWDYERCEKYSIFLSQGNYPLKGLHYVLEAMPELLEKYPEAKLYVSGDIITSYETLKEKIKIGAYGKYCLSLIRKGKLRDKVVFLGRLDEKEMLQRFLRSHVAILPSAIENSPNSLGEAMLLGMPCVASRVGGVTTLMTREEGFLYDKGDKDGLIRAISTVFKMGDTVAAYGRKAAVHARKTHDAEANYNRLVEIYHQIVKG